MGKISFRFYKDHEVRAIWNDEENKWYFSIVDIVAAITESPRPRVYWGTVINVITCFRIISIFKTLQS